MLRLRQRKAQRGGGGDSGKEQERLLRGQFDMAEQIRRQGEQQIQAMQQDDPFRNIRDSLRGF
jgi:hypothetical protein